MTTQSTMFDSFAKISEDQWLEHINQNFEHTGKPVSDTYTLWDEKIQIAPLYTQAPAVRFPTKEILYGNQWYRCVEISLDKSTLTKEREEILIYLDAGANALHFNFRDDYIDLEQLFHGISFPKGDYAVYFSGEVKHISSAYRSVIKNMQSQGIATFIDTDTPNSGEDERKGFSSRSSVCVASKRSDYSLVEGLADALYRAHRLLCIAPDRYMYFKIRISPDFFSEIIRLRVLRILWEFIRKPYELNQNAKPHIQAVMLLDEQKDSYANMIQTSSEVLSAVIGGADTLVIPSLPLEGRKDFVAQRNQKILGIHQQLLLKEEAYFEDVIDPSRGSYYLDTLTDKLCRAAYSRFQSKFD